MMFCCRLAILEAKRAGASSRWLAFIPMMTGVLVLLGVTVAITEVFFPVEWTASASYLLATFFGLGWNLGVFGWFRKNVRKQGTLHGTDGKTETFVELVWKRFRKHRLAYWAACVLIILIDVSLLAEVIEGFLGVNHADTAMRQRYQEPGWPHLLGTDELGRDLFTRLVFGGQISLSVGLISALSSATIGTVIGLVAGYYGGWVDSALMRFTDAMLAIPVLPLMIVFSALDLMVLFEGSSSLFGPFFFCGLIAALATAYRLFWARQGNRAFANYPFFRSFIDGGLIWAFTFGAYFLVFRLLDWERIAGGNLGSVIKIILIIVFFGWMTVARLARAAALQLKNMEFVTAARALGGSDRRILMSHILPNALAPIIVAATLEVGGNILYEAALSFLGLGVQPPVPSWGNMLNNALDYIKRDPLLAFWPGLLILLTVSCFNFFGDGMRDALDPHQVMKGK